ncbi:hypothetical protein [Microvirga rosea]|uniref:hypothetical protein n=1 Tax=Microvirga rosea TaxID=2715425 RepID=UPI001D0B6F0C|nr:hypothetical protein [Microvirga rosea]MCB8819961.1 hypothetical protein [Microvirga rosea]
MEIPDLGIGAQATLPVSQLENLARLAADHAASQVVARAPTKEEVEQIAKAAANEAAESAVEHGIERFLERAGIDPNDMANLRKDFASMRSSREIKEAIVKQGFLAVMTILLGGIRTAIMFLLRGGGIK